MLAELFTMELTQIMTPQTTDAKAVTVLLVTLLLLVVAEEACLSTHLPILLMVDLVAVVVTTTQVLETLHHGVADLLHKEIQVVV